MQKMVNENGIVRMLPLLLVIAAIGIISFLLITSTAPTDGLFGLLNPKPKSHAAVTNNCGLQLGGNAIFCYTFDAPTVSRPSRSGDLDPDVWGVSRGIGGGYLGNPWVTSTTGGCNGTTTVNAPNDIKICNGRLQETTNDGHDVTVLAMYPKQPFDWAGRTGTVSFDVSNDTQGSHAAWPEFWVSDAPVPMPFSHFNSWIAYPKNGFGIRMAINGEIGSYGMCPNGNNLDKRRWTVDSAVIIRNYVYEDTEGYGTPSGTKLTITDCVVDADGPNSGLNHVEVRVSQNLIEIWASDAGSTALRKIAYISNANLSLTRGLIWLQDAHYNASKGACPPQYNGNPTCQDTHTFAWDNVAFDGPFTYRDFSYDALDNNVPGPLFGNSEPTVELGKSATFGAFTSWNIDNVPAPLPGTEAAKVLFNWTTLHQNLPTNIYVKVNGNLHVIPYPYPANDTCLPDGTSCFGVSSWRTYALTVPITDLKPTGGTNLVEIGTDLETIVANVNLVMVNVPGGVPVLPGSNNAFPGPTPIPVSSSTPFPTSTPIPSVTPTPCPSCTPVPTPTPNPSAPPTPVVTVPTCIDQGYSGSGVTISWPSVTPAVSVVDLGLDSNFNTAYNKYTTNGATSLTGPAGFSNGTSSPTLNPNTAYFTRTYNGVRSQVVSFSIPSCSGATPTPVPTTSVCQGADLDRNGSVNIFDYNILVGNFGKTSAGLQGDIDGNGKVDIFDYNILVGNFGKTAC